MAGRLTDKNTIITGGGAGIGLAIARLFGLEGASVSILDRDEARCKQAEAGLRQEGIDVVAYCVDVADAPSVAKAFKQIVAHYANIIHVLVNNAGIAEFAGVEEATLSLIHI